MFFNDIYDRRDVVFKSYSFSEKNVVEELKVVGAVVEKYILTSCVWHSGLTGY